MKDVFTPVCILKIFPEIVQVDFIMIVNSRFATFIFLPLLGKFLNALWSICCDEFDQTDLELPRSFYRLWYTINL